MGAVGDDCVGIGVIHFDPNALVENVAESVEISSTGGGVVAVIDDSAVELVDVVVAGIFDKTGEFFASNSSRAVGQDLFACESVGVVVEPLGEVAKVSDIGAESAFEMAEFAFVIVPRINQDGVFLLHRIVKIDRRKVSAGCFVGIDIGFVRQAKSNDFMTNFDRKFWENVAFAAGINFKRHVSREWIGMKRFDVGFGVGDCSGDSSVETFIAN